MTAPSRPGRQATELCGGQALWLVAAADHGLVSDVMSDVSEAEAVSIAVRLRAHFAARRDVSVALRAAIDAAASRPPGTKQAWDECGARAVVERLVAVPASTSPEMRHSGRASPPAACVRGRASPPAACVRVASATAVSLLTHCLSP